MLYPTIMSKTATLLSATVKVEDVRYLKLDPQITYFSEPHKIVFYTFGLFAVVIYIIGFPLLGISVLYRHRNERFVPAMTPEEENALDGKDKERRVMLLTRNKAIRLRYCMLYDGYNEKYWWWEITVVLRKMAIILAGTFIDGTQQLLTVLLIIAFIMFLTALCRPFHNNSLLTLELFSLGLVFFTFWVGSMILIDPDCFSRNDNWCSRTSLFVLFLNVMALIVFLANFAYAFWEEKGIGLVDMIISCWKNKHKHAQSVKAKFINCCSCWYTCCKKENTNSNTTSDEPLLREENQINSSSISDYNYTELEGNERVKIKRMSFGIDTTNVGSSSGQ
jgi:hypothetical protein